MKDVTPVMKKKCSVCGAVEENVWQDGHYYCAFCGNEIDVTQYDENIIENTQTNTNEITRLQNTVDAVCPLCKNNKEIFLKNGKCCCPICGTEFDLRATKHEEVIKTNVSAEPESAEKAAKRAALEKEKEQKMIMGIIGTLIFLPVGLYYFYQMYQVIKEIEKL